MSTPELCLAIYSFTWFVLNVLSGYGVLEAYIKMFNFVLDSFFRALVIGRKAEIDQDIEEMQADLSELRGQL